MNKKRLATTIGIMIFGLTLAGAGFAKQEKIEIKQGSIKVEKQSEAEFPSMAKLSMDQAVEKALGAVDGQVLKVALENEDGFLVYGVEVAAQDKSVIEVKIDAGTGKVLATEEDREDRKNEKHDGDKEE